MTLSAHQNNKIAQFLLGFEYLYLNEPEKYMQKAIRHFQYSAENKLREAQIILGDFYFEGKYLEYDIKKAIHLYKEFSCFNNIYAKNNL